MLDRIWTGFFLVAFVAAVFQSLVLGETGVWAEMVGATFDLSKTAFEIALGLTGVMCLWLGLMRIGEKAGAVEWLARAFANQRIVKGIICDCDCASRICSRVVTSVRCATRNSR